MLLDMDMVAEGVDTASPLQKPQSLHGDQMQGFLLGRPMPPEAFAAQVRGWLAPA